MNKLKNRGWAKLLALIILTLAFSVYQVIQRAEKDHFSSVDRKERCIISYLELFQVIYSDEMEVPPKIEDFERYITENNAQISTECRVDAAVLLRGVWPSGNRLNLYAEKCQGEETICFTSM